MRPAWLLTEQNCCAGKNRAIAPEAWSLQEVSVMLATQQSRDEDPDMEMHAPSRLGQEQISGRYVQWNLDTAGCPDRYSRWLQECRSSRQYQACAMQA